MLSENIRRLRKSRHLSQTQLAEALGMAQATVACWENGSRRPDIDMLPSIAAFFGISTDELLGLPVDTEQEDLWRLREEVRRDPDRQALFSLARKADIRDVRRVLALLDALKKTGEDE